MSDTIKTIKVLFAAFEAAPFMKTGGLGDVAIRYGYYRYNQDVMIVTVVLLVIIVQILQEIFMGIARKSDKRL